MLFRYYLVHTDRQDKRENIISAAHLADINIGPYAVGDKEHWCSRQGNINKTYALMS